MAELKIGKHCSVSVCKQLDFLPFECQWCHQIFCLDHRSPDCHDCKEYNHSDTPVYDGVKSLPCSLEGCNSSELVPVVCEHCHKNFCLKHRHQIDHSCSEYTAPSSEPSKTAQHVSKILESKPANPPKKPSGKKSKATAAKVALMKMKMKAIGDKSIPDSEKIYLQILLPKENKERSKPMFFSKKWTIGRVIDGITKTIGLKNENNIAGAKKLKFFTDDGSQLIPSDKTLEQVLKHYPQDVINGSNVILEYVNEEAVTLENTDLYSIKP